MGKRVKHLFVIRQKVPLKTLEALRQLLDVRIRPLERRVQLLAEDLYP